MVDLVAFLPLAIVGGAVFIIYIYFSRLKKNNPNKYEKILLAVQGAGAFLAGSVCVYGSYELWSGAQEVINLITVIEKFNIIITLLRQNYSIFDGMFILASFDLAFSLLLAAFLFSMFITLPMFGVILCLIPFMGIANVLARRSSSENTQDKLIIRGRNKKEYPHSLKLEQDKIREEPPLYRQPDQ